MKKIKRFIAVCFIVLLLIPASGVRVGANTTESSPQVTGVYRYSLAYEMLSLTNEERVKEGLPPLVMDASLLESAMKRSTELTVLFSHTRPDGTQWYAVDNKAYGENVAEGDVAPEAIMDMWMNSEGHKANILKDDFTTIGIGCFEKDGNYYWVQLFGKGKAEPVGKQPADYEATVSVNTDPNNNTSKNNTTNDIKNGTTTNSDEGEDKVSNGKVPKAKIASLTKLSTRKVKLTIKKISGAEGYEVLYSTNKKFKKSTVKTVKKANAKIAKLKKGKKYFFKVRAYITDANGNKVYGNYSKKIKIKM